MSTTIPRDAFAFIIGAMKCGTTSLYEHLVQHPQICPSGMKEPEFFSRNQGHGLVDTARYEDLWDFDPDVHRYVLEASTGYSKFPMEQGVPQRMRDYGIRPRLLYLVRNPFDRIESHYNYMVTRPTWNLGITDEHLIDISRYARQLEEYSRCFPRESLLVLEFDALRVSPDRLLARVWEFLGLPAAPPLEEAEVRNPTVQLSRAELALRKGWTGRLLRLFPDPVKQAGRKLMRRYTPASSKRVLTESERSLVRERLAADMERLRAEYGVDVGRWGF